MADPTEANRTTRAKARPDLPPGTSPWSSPADTRPAPQPRPEPTKGGFLQFPSHDGASIWWFVAVVGVGLFMLAHVVATFTALDDLGGDAEAPVLIATLGRVAVCSGLVLAGLLQKELSLGLRVALLIAGCYLAAVSAASPLTFLGLFS